MVKKDIEDLQEKYISNLSSDDRFNLIDEILLRYISKKSVYPRKEGKISFFLGGGSNSGKSTFRDTLTATHNDLLVIDSDELKKEIPEYDDLVFADSTVAASIVHKESSQMASLLLTKAIEKEISSLFDGTLKNAQKYVDFIHLLRQAGFEVHLVIIDVPVEIALERNRIRYEEAKAKGEHPRLVPDEDIILSHSSIAKSFMALKKLVDSWMIIDTRGDTDDIIAYLDNDKIENILNNEKYQEFLNK